MIERTYWLWDRWSPEDDGYNLYAPGEQYCCAQIIPNKTFGYELTFLIPTLKHRKYVGKLKDLKKLGIKAAQNQRRPAA
jgi:hypothetical protein